MDHHSVPERFTVEANRRQSTVREPYYPRSIRELGKTETRMLTSILHLDNTGPSSHHGLLIGKLIQSLPKRLRRARPLSRIRSTGLCDIHKGLNSDLMNDILTRIQREVTVGFRQIEEYPELVGPVESEILAKLRALQGMWTKPQPQTDTPVAPNALPYQINKCAACILAHVASDGEMIRNLRVVLQSRTRTRKNHRAPTLIVFVDECIRQFGGDKADELFGTASNLAFQMKATRKACVKAWLNENDNKDSRRDQRRRRGKSHHDRKSDGSTDQPCPGSHALSATDRTSYATRTSESSSTRESEQSRRLTSLTPATSQPSLVSRGKSLYMHPEQSIASMSLYEAPFRANNSTTSIRSWSEVERELSMIKTCREIANDNPYSQATSAPEARVAPLRVSRADSQYEEQLHMGMGSSYGFPHSFLDYSSSDYTDAFLSDDEDPAFTFESQPQLQPQARPRVPALEDQPRAMTTWDMMVDQSNMI